MNGKRTRQLRRDNPVSRKLFHDGVCVRGDGFRRVKKDYLRPAATRIAHASESIPTIDARDKNNWAHGKMKRSGVYATRRRA